MKHPGEWLRWKLGDNSTAMRLAARSRCGQARLAWTWPPRLGCWLPYRQRRMGAVSVHPGHATRDGHQEPARPVQHRAGPPERELGQLRLGSQAELAKGLMGNIEAYSSAECATAAGNGGLQLGKATTFERKSAPTRSSDTLPAGWHNPPAPLPCLSRTRRICHISGSGTHSVSTNPATRPRRSAHPRLHLPAKAM